MNFQWQKKKGENSLGIDSFPFTSFPNEQMADHDHRTNASRTPASDRGSDSGSSNDNDDDVWGDDDNVSYDRSIAEREWSRLHENFGNVSFFYYYFFFPLAV